ncbi:APC family permease [Paremcibacter congregatus]|uniref:Amino acid permease n=1 Tax=Paremcibacter congregatus TaxID=2043170 RepID=A0A2G4YW23_9PROT|nr:amino acid permease [Paremcibacter congregatus]PHZ86541.1 hypothetical protein CRD36_01270 [Paremcibacter congregatus]QDE26345.1 amino acid permease [Paremcibacter congregatus]
MNTSSLHRTIGLKSAVFIIIGFIVGATIFVLPGSLAVEAGPAVFLAYLLASIPAIFACFVMAQVGGAFPVSGASFMIVSKVLSPYWGFIYLCLLVPMAAIIVPLIAFGFADYLQHFFPRTDVTITSITITLLFMITNCFGIDFAAKIQGILVVFFLLTLTIFGVGGVAQGDAELIKPFFPKGFSPVVLAAVTAYFSYSGVFVITEIAGEIKNPSRTIPRAIFISFAVILAIYTLVPLALVMTLPWASYADTSMAVVTAAEVFLPDWIVDLIAISALFAAATSINGLLMALSRDWFKGAEVNIFPKYFAKIDERRGVPVRAVLLVGLLSMAGIFIGGTITDYAQAAVLGIMVMQILTGIAVLRLPKLLPEVYEQAHFKLGPRALIFYSLGFIIFSAAFFLFLGAFSLTEVVIGVIYLCLCSLYFKIRIKTVQLKIQRQR